jgi:hypothetical protein
MKRLMKHLMTPRCIVPLLAAGLAGCATPRVALEQANHGVVLIEGLRTELLRYQDNTAIAAQRRLKAIERDEAYIRQATAERAFSDFLQQRSGMLPQSEAETLLRQTADERGRVVDEPEAQRRALATRLAALLDALPSPADKLAATQKTMVALGTELSPAERTRIVASFLGDVRRLVDAQRAKAADATAQP